jgi:hypothetical protein
MVLLWNARSQQSGTIKLDDASTEMCRTATTTRRARPFRTAGTENVNPDTSLTGSVFIGSAATVSSLCRMGTSDNRAAPILIRTHSSTVDSSDSGYVHKRKYTTSPTTPLLRYSAPLPQLKGDLTSAQSPTLLDNTFRPPYPTLHFRSIYSSTLRTTCARPWLPTTRCSLTPRPCPPRR